MAAENYDLVVIGSGPAGYVAAIRAAQLGFKTACVEKWKTLGGTCLNVGCIPSKALLESSEHYHYAKTKFQKHGVTLGTVALDLGQMMNRKDTIVRQLTQGISGLFKKNKIDSFVGHGKLLPGTGPERQVEVTGESGKQILNARKILIATGSVPSSLPGLAFDGKKIISSTEALELKEVPRHMVVVGGGVIGLELGSVWLRLGAKVTVIEFQDRILPPSDKQTAAELYKSLVRQGMEFKLASKVIGAEPGNNAMMTLTAVELANGNKFRVECDYILVAVGRKPYTENLGLEDLGVKLDKQGRIETDAHYQTNVPGVYAVGDVITGPMLAHKSEEEGIAVVEIMAGQAGHVNYEAIPNVVYTWPELASVGATEEELKAKDIAYKSGSFPFLANARAKSMEENEGFVKILADAKSDRVLGVHIVGPRASDMIAEAVAVMEFGGSAEDIARTCHAHPTLSEIVKEAALAVDKRQIHL
jgi:dihydrolipoamide dehydrogenase